MFKEYQCTEYVTQTIVHTKKVFDMKALHNIQGLVILLPTGLSLSNTRYVSHFQTVWTRKVPSGLIPMTYLVAFFNERDKKILIMRNRITGDTGVFDYEL